MFQSRIRLFEFFDMTYLRMESNITCMEKKLRFIRNQNAMHMWMAQCFFLIEIANKMESLFHYLDEEELIISASRQTM